MFGPKLKLPPGACDTHMHFYHSRFPTAPTALSTQPDATPEDYRKVQHLLGHTQVKTTQRYAHLSPDTLLAAANAASTAVGSLMGVMPSSVSNVPLIQAGG